MHQALELASRAADQDEVPVGAVVVLKNEIIGEGYNRREQAQDPCGHAEIYALRAAAQKIGSWRLNGCHLFVTLEPCPMCLAACQQARVRMVSYGAEDKKGGALSLGHRLHDDLRLNHQFEVVYEPDPACQQILKDFFKRKR